MFLSFGNLCVFTYICIVFFDVLFCLAFLILYLFFLFMYPLLSNVIVDYTPGGDFNEKCVYFANFMENLGEYYVIRRAAYRNYIHSHLLICISMILCKCRRKYLNVCWEVEFSNSENKFKRLRP